MHIRGKCIYERKSTMDGLKTNQLNVVNATRYMFCSEAN